MTFHFKAKEREAQFFSLFLSQGARKISRETSSRPVHYSIHGAQSLDMFNLYVQLCLMKLMCSIKRERIASRLGIEFLVSLVLELLTFPVRCFQFHQQHLTSWEWLSLHRCSDAFFISDFFPGGKLASGVYAVSPVGLACKPETSSVPTCFPER